MEKMILSSDGISSNKIKKEFIRLLEKPIQEAKILVIHTLRDRGFLKYLKLIKLQLRDLGLNKKNIFYANISNNIKPPKDKFDAIYFCGGNTFYILDRVKKTGFDKFIKKFVKSERLYLGASAGSMITHKTIELAGYGSDADDNDINLKNLNGLNLTNIAIYPHYHASLKKELAQFKKKVKYPVVYLKDKQALVILGKNKRII